MDINSTQNVLQFLLSIGAAIGIIYTVNLKFLIPDLSKKYVKVEDFLNYKKAVRGDIDDLTSRLSLAEKNHSTDHDILVRLEERINWIIDELQVKRKTKK